MGQEIATCFGLISCGLELKPEPEPEPNLLIKFLL